eukprot:2347106-Prymnesium_polylepis.1
MWRRARSGQRWRGRCADCQDGGVGRLSRAPPRRTVRPERRIGRHWDHVDVGIIVRIIQRLGVAFNRRVRYVPNHSIFWLPLADHEMPAAERGEAAAEADS